MNDLQFLLDEKTKGQNNLTTSDQISAKTSSPHRASKSASLDNFIEMIAQLCPKVLKKYNTIFCPDEGIHPKIDPDENLEQSYVFYEIIERKPYLEKKPREREQILENYEDVHQKRPGKILGQKFICLIQFNFLACDYKTANEVMNTFERMIFDYTHSFKEQGVAEIFFEKQYTDKNLFSFRQTLSVRSLQYRVYIENLYPVFESEIMDITVL